LVCADRLGNEGASGKGQAAVVRPNRFPTEPPEEVDGGRRAQVRRGVVRAGPSERARELVEPRLRSDQRPDVPALPLGDDEYG
jgi:hypothetical protein